MNRRGPQKIAGALIGPRINLLNGDVMDNGILMVLIFTLITGPHYTRYRSAVWSFTLLYRTIIIKSCGSSTIPPSLKMPNPSEIGKPHYPSYSLQLLLITLSFSHSHPYHLSIPTYPYTHIISRRDRPLTYKSRILYGGTCSRSRRQQGTDSSSSIQLRITRLACLPSCIK